MRIDTCGGRGDRVLRNFKNSHSYMTSVTSNCSSKRVSVNFKNVLIVKEFGIFSDIFVFLKQVISLIEPLPFVNSEAVLLSCESLIDIDQSLTTKDHYICGKRQRICFMSEKLYVASE